MINAVVSYPIDTPLLYYVALCILSITGFSCLERNTYEDCKKQFCGSNDGNHEQQISFRSRRWP